MTQAKKTMRDSVEDALIYVLWHHQGGSSEIGQPIRKMLGMGQFDNMSDEQYARAKTVQMALIAEYSGKPSL